MARPENGPLPCRLVRPEAKFHGLGQSALYTMTIEAFQNMLAATRDDWSIIPEDREAEA